MSISTLTGTITDISRCSLHDGPGVRTVVYFKGCGLRCQWCHNPETLSTRKELMYLASRCIGCGRCVQTCPEGNIHVERPDVEEGVLHIDRNICKACGQCAESCPSGALRLIGQEITTEELMKEIRKDRHFYEATGGGVTLSGGECLLQSEFIMEVLKKCKEEGIHTAIETALYVPWEAVEMVLPWVDLVYADLKLADPMRHKEYTGQSNERILSNLRKLTVQHKNVVIRIPLIPGVNDTEAELLKIQEIIASLEGRQAGVEVLKYNYLAESKYEGVGRKFTRFSDTTQSDSEIAAVLEKIMKKR